MRITSNMMVKNYMRGLYRNLKRVDEYNRQLSTGKRINTPQDDPVGAAVTMHLSSSLESNERYIQNIDYALAWMDTTEDALSRAGEIMHSGRELAVYGLSDTMTGEERQTIIDELEQLREGMVELSNVTHAGRHVFSGYNTGEAAYIFEGGEAQYRGVSGELNIEISPGVEMVINVNGEDAFDDAFAALDSTITALEEGEVNGEEQSTVLTELDEALDTILAYRSDIGARMNRLDLSENRLKDFEINLQQLRSKTEDVDIAEAIMNLRMEESVYRASLAAGARIIQPSLVDFLR